MDTQTRHALKQDKFVTATTSGLEWIEANRAPVIRWAIAAVLAIGLLVAGLVVWHQRSQAANQLLDKALDVYQTPLAPPGQPLPPGLKTYPTAKARANAAYPLFEKVASQYGWERAGAMAEYFAGVTQIDLNEPQQAEATLKKASHSHQSGVAALAKLALANLYGQQGQTSKAESLFKALIAHPTNTVTKGAAMLQLAQMYETTNPQQAKLIYAQIQDQDKGSQAAQIAEQKLHGTK